MKIFVGKKVNFKVLGTYILTCTSVSLGEIK